MAAQLQRVQAPRLPFGLHEIVQHAVGRGRQPEAETPS